MSPQPPSSIENEITQRHDREQARGGGDPRPPRPVQRLSAWRDARLVRQALKVAGEPGLILDLACGSGRFWPVLAEHVNRVILASDNSQAMLDHARTHHPGTLLKRVKTFQGSAFSIGLSANAVDCIFCLDLFRHVPGSDARLMLLHEFHRVSRDTVIVAVNVGTPVESEFRQAGFKILNYQEFLPGSRRWCVYVLRKRG